MAICLRQNLISERHIRLSYGTHQGIMDFDMAKPDNRAAVYDIFYRADNNMWAQKVIDFVILTWISRRTYREDWYCDIIIYTYTKKGYIL